MSQETRVAVTSGTIEPGSERAAEWEWCFGGLTVPLLEPFPKPATAPGYAPGTLFYRMPLDWLAPEQLDALVHALGARYKLSEAEVRADLERDRFLPILAAGVVVGVSVEVRVPAETGPPKRKSERKSERKGEAR